MAGIQPLTKEQARRVLEEADKMGTRDSLLIRILMYTGMRVGELAPLSVGDVDPIQGSLTLSKVIVQPQALVKRAHGRLLYDQKVPLTFLGFDAKGYTGKNVTLLPADAAKRFRGETIKSGLKAGQPTRVVPLTDGTTRNLLTAWITGQNPRAFVFRSQKGGRHLGKLQFQRAGKRAMLAAGLDPAICHVHNLRHTFAVNALKAGVDLVRVSRILGHTKVSTTAIYLRFVVDDLREALEKAGDIFR